MAVAPVVDRAISWPEYMVDAICNVAHRVFNAVKKALETIHAWIFPDRMPRDVEPGRPRAERPVQVRPELIVRHPMVQSLQTFYRGTGRDAEGRTLDWILSQDDAWLELTPNYIQWLFPTSARTRFNGNAPLLTTSFIENFNEREKTNLYRSLERMMCFYGIHWDRRTNQFTRNLETFTTRSQNWVTRGNHNFLRLTRILSCLRALGERDVAGNLLQLLLNIAENEGGEIIHGRTIRQWRLAA